MSLLDENTAAQFDRLPPHSIDAERCLIAAMMLDKAAVDTAQRAVDRNAFFLADHQILFDVIVRLHEQGRSVDAIVVREELIKRQLLAEVGGIEYLAKILGTIPSAAHAEMYAKTVREKWLLRRMISTANDMLRDAYGPHQDADEVLGRAQERMLEITRTSSSLEDAVPLEQILYEVYDEATGGGTPMLQLPFKALNDWLGGGVALGEFVIVAGWPSHGKSAACKQFGEYLAATGHPGGIVSLEEGRKKIARNLLSAESLVPNRRIRAGTLDANECAAVADAIVALAKIPYYVQERALTLRQVAAAVCMGVARQKWEWAVVDHFDLIDLGEVNEENERTKHATLSRTIKNTAKALGIPIFGVKQLRKRGIGIRKPTPDDLRETGAYHADADIVIFVDSDDVHHREDRDWQPNFETDFILSKAREGMPGIHKVRWDAAVQRYQEL